MVLVGVAVGVLVGVSVGVTVGVPGPVTTDRVTSLPSPAT
jgi:hypothetical protein